MKGKIFVWISAICLVSLFLLQCKSKPEKPVTNQPPVVKTDDSIVFRELKKLASYHKADSFYVADGYDSAIYYYNKTLSEPTLSPNPIFKQEIFNRISYSYILFSNYKKAEYYIGKALAFHVDRDVNLVNANTFYCFGVLNHYKNESDSALYYFHKAYNSYFRILGGSNLQIVKLNFQIGNVYRWIRFDYNNAEKYYYKALQIFESQGFDKKDDQYFRILYFLSSTNRLKKDYNKSLSYGLQALQLANTVKSHKRYIEISYALVANIYLALKDLRSSIDYYNKALEINSKNTKNKNEYRPLYYDNLALAYYELGNYNSALFYSKKALKISNKSKPDYTEISACHEHLGLSYQALHHWRKAYENINQCIAIRLRYLGLKHPRTADAYNLLGKYFETRQNLDSALYYYQLAIISGSLGFRNHHINSNPSFSQSITNIGLLDYLALKASALKQKYLHNPGDTLSLVTSLKCYELLDSLISFSRKSMDTEKSKLSISLNSNEFYEEAIGCAFQAYKKNKDKQYIEKAFRFFERNKYLLLLEKLKMAEAGSKAGVPDSLVEQEQNLNSELKFAQDKLAEEQSKDDNPLQIQSLNSRIFSLMRAIERLHSIYQQKYPNYFKIKYEDEPKDLNDLQKYAIEKGTDIIQYFWGEKSVYAIGVTGNVVSFTKIDNNKEFRDSLSSIIHFMHNINLSPQALLREYSGRAFYFYNVLVSQVLEKQEVKNHHAITIIPDGLLAKLSFEALLTSATDLKKYSYKKFSYLVYQHDIQYAYSSNILLSKTNNNRKRYFNKLLGFGYSDGNINRDKNDLSGYSRDKNDLPGSSVEMKAVSKYFRTKLFLGLKATENNFKKKAAGYDIIHLALHGKADEENEKDTKLIFRTDKDKIDDGMLYANEIYGLNLNSKLVVLSACETGLGKNYLGEGVFSMARAFSYAGCPSSVISLWKVNDHSSAVIMENFYKYLSNGEGIGESLHRAKLEYLKNSSEIALQPVYWASFVAFGDMSPIKAESNYIFWLVLAVIIVVGGFIVYRFGLLQKIFCRH